MKIKWIYLPAAAALLAFGYFLLRQHSRHDKDAVASKDIKPTPVSANSAAPSSSVRAAMPLSNAVTNLEVLSAPVRSLIDYKQDYRKRESAVTTLSAVIPNADLQALYAFLLHPAASDREQGEQVLKNLLLDRLCERNPLPAGLSDALLQMYRDKNQDAVLRDYAVQHLAAFYQQAEINHENDPQQEQAIQNALWEALNEKYNSIAGTALLALTRLADGRPEFDEKQIGATALRMAEDNDSSELTRSAAMQISARLGVKGVLPILMKNAQDGGTLSLRISAIGALGVLGQADAIPLLNEFLNGSEDRLKLPARQALKQIEFEALTAQAGNNQRGL